MSGTATKLSIDSQYLIHTNYGTYMGDKIKVKAILNYEKASEISFSIKNLAINEKVIDVNADETDTYLASQLYYLCEALDGSGTQYLFWDDIIDIINTTKLSTKYSYNLDIEVDASLVANLPTIENSIVTFIKSTYGNAVKPTLIANGEVESSLDNKTQELNKYKEMCNEASTVIDKIAKLKQIESLINYFAKDDMYTKITELSESLDYIKSTVSTISAQIS